MSRARDLADRVLHNRTHEDTDGGRESIVTFKGEQSGGEISTLAQIQASHDGTSDDEKADLIFKTNDGSDGASPTEAMRIDSAQNIAIGTTAPTTFSGFKTLHFKNGSGDAISLVESDGGVISQEISSDSTGVTLGSRSNHNLRITTNDTERMGIDSDGKTTLTNTSAGASTTPLVLHNASSNANTDVKMLLAPCTTAADRPVILAGTNNGSNVCHFTVSTPNGGTPAERMRVGGDGTIFLGTTLAFGGKVNVHEGGIGVGEATGAGYYRRMYWNAANNEMRFWNGTNEARITDSGVFTNASDISLKKDIADIEYGIDTVKSLQPRKYKMKSDDKEQVGFIAQEMESHVPEIVSVGVTPDGDEHKGISYGQLTAVLTKALQEAIAKIETLETENTAIKARLDALEAE